MRPPCESVVQFVLPAFRCLVAKELVEKYKFSQVKAARKLGTTQAAISQYFSSRRGEKRMRAVRSAPRIRSAAKKLAREIATDRASGHDAMIRFCKLCMVLRDNGLVCDFHRERITDKQKCKICLDI